jgi:hypothetical protein
MKKNLLIAAGLCLSAFVLSMSMDADAAGKPRSERGHLVHAIVMKWGGHVREAYGTSAHHWAMEMVPLFAKVSIGRLKSAASATSFDAMNNLLLVESAGVDPGEPAPTPGGVVSPDAFGDADRELIYVPVTPCRILDTRVAGGAIAANTTRGFDITAVSNYSFQGGDASNCGGVGAAGSFAAAVINFTVVTPNTAGFITAFPFGGTQPLAATVNYNAGDIRGNLAVVKLDQGASANELSVYSFAQTHLVGDIVGYFTNPQPLVFECVNTAETTVTIGAGASGNAFAAACPVGYTQTATNCKTTSFLMPIVFQADGACSARNNSGSNADLIASRTCCRARRT